MSGVRKFLSDLTTESDGTSFCPVRLGLLIGFIAFIGLSIYAALHDKGFDPSSWGTGYGTLLGAGGGSVWMKSKGE